MEREGCGRMNIFLLFLSLSQMINSGQILSQQKISILINSQTFCRSSSILKVFAINSQSDYICRFFLTTKFFFVLWTKFIEVYSDNNRKTAETQGNKCCLKCSTKNSKKGNYGTEKSAKRVIKCPVRSF